MPNVYDTSLISQVENWIATTIGALSLVASGESKLFTGFQGWDQPLGTRIQEILESSRRPCAITSWIGSSGMSVQHEVHKDRESRYIVVLCAENFRPAAARVGESGSVVGTNALVEVVINALHDKRPNVTSDLLGLTAQETRVGNSRPIATPRGLSIVEIEVICREVPTGA